MCDYERDGIKRVIKNGTQQIEPLSFWLENLFLGKPCRDRLRDIRQQPVHNEIRCSKNENGRVPDAGHESSTETKRRRPMRSRFRQEKRCQGVKSVQTGQIAANRPPVASLKPNNCLSGNAA